MTRTEIIQATRVLDLPRITAGTSQAQVLWIHGYYDGPLSGMVMYDGHLGSGNGPRMCWFSTPDVPDLPKRRFFLYDLEDWEIVKITTRHILFEMYVGTHHCRHVFGNERGPIKPRELHNKFYDLERDNWSPADGKRPFAKLISKGTRNKK